MKKLFLLAFALALPVIAQADPYCREYTQVTKIGGISQKNYGLACLQADGSWQMVTAAQPMPLEPQNTAYIIEQRPHVVYVPRPTVVRIFVGNHGHPHNNHRYWQRPH